jgi:hypothetical protein
MFALQNITSAIEIRVLVITNNLTSIVGLLVFGFPVSSAAIRTMLVSWVLIAVAIMQFVLRHFRPEMSPVRVSTLPSRSANSDVTLMVRGA